MPFGKALATACASFAITNVDDLFVLVTFFAEAATSKTLTPARIVIGQYAGFTVVIAISMIGFGASLALPSEPIGFLGLLPSLLGVWLLFGLLLPTRDELKDEGAEGSNVSAAKGVAKVASVTVMNGGDNIGTYVPLFSQAKGAEIAVYVVTYYILLGAWCLVALLVMRQRHVLSLFQKYAGMAIPFLYMGLGIYIIIKSRCYPWSIEHINDAYESDPGVLTMGLATSLLLSTAMSAMVWSKLRKQSAQRRADGGTVEENLERTAESGSAPGTCPDEDQSGIALTERTQQDAGNDKSREEDSSMQKP